MTMMMAEVVVGLDGDGPVGPYNKDHDENGDDALRLLFRKLAAQQASDVPSYDGTPYIMLIQHRHTSSHVRWVAATMEATPSSSSGERGFSGRKGPNVGGTGPGGSEASVYWRAGLRTPSENARRDWEGPPEWMYGVTERLCREFESVVYVGTLTKRLPHWLPPPLEEGGVSSYCSDWRRTLLVVDAATDPFGWNTALTTTDDVNKNDDMKPTATATARQPNLESLDELVEHLRSTATREMSQHERRPGGRTPLVLQSLAPLLHRHGFSRTLHFLQTLAGAFCPLVVPVAADALSAAQHRVLEGLSQALLSLDGGDAVLVRRGVRERDNVVRELLDFDIVSDGKTSKTTPSALPAQCRIRLLRLPRFGETGYNNDVVVADRAQPLRPPPPAPEKVDKHGGRRAVSLELAPDDAPRTTAAMSAAAPAPHIFVEDDDPEYHDYDEEDPDDDLDL